MTFSSKVTTKKAWRTICNTSDLIKDSGISALLINEINKADEANEPIVAEQIAIFHLPNSEEKIYAVGNYDPIGKANVLYRGIVGCIADEPVVASPLYKQHFSLKTGRCLQEEQSIAVYVIRIENQQVQVFY